MPLTAHQIRAFTELTWSTMLGVHAEEDSREDPALEPDARCIEASIAISGEWNLAVLLRCPLELARVLAARMLCIDPQAVLIEDLKDALGELANMVGGGIKNMIAEGLHLSLPTVWEESASRPRTEGRLVHRLGFRTEGQPFMVSLVERP